MISKTKPFFNFAEIKEVLFSSGDSVLKFEEGFAKKMGYKHALSFAYGRSGLYYFLESMGIKKKKVVVPAYTCIVVPNAIKKSENEPAFVDVSIKNFCPVFSSKLNKDVGCVVPTHMYGFYNDFSGVADTIKDRRLDIPLIEDAALAIGTKNAGKKSDGAFYSFNIAKQICTFDGGMFATNNEEIYEKMKKIRDERCRKQAVSVNAKKAILFKMSYFAFNNLVYGMTYTAYYSLFNNMFSKQMQNWDLESIAVPDDYDTLLSNFQAKLGLSQINKIDEIVEKRKKIAKMYSKEIDNKLFHNPAYQDGCSYSHYPLIAKEKGASIKKLRSNGLNLGNSFDYDYCVPCTKPYLEKECSKRFKNSFLLAKSIITLPIRPNLSNSDVKFIIEKINGLRI